MNEELIKTLWWKARIGYNEQNCDPEVLAKFAELLLKECIKVCEPVFLDESYEDMSEFGKGLVEGQDVAVEKIKEHFGVEE